MQDQVEEEEEVVVVLAWVLVLLAGCLQVRDRCLGVNQEAGSAEEVVVVDLVEVVVVWVDLVVVVALVVVAWLQWRFLVRVYARAQIALKETFEANELGQAEVEAADLPAGLLEAAHLDSVRLAKGSPVIDQRIGELELRANTGVSIVGIERDGERIVNPGPEETLLEGDRLLLLGEDTKLPKAKAELNG